MNVCAQKIVKNLVNKMQLTWIFTALQDCTELTHPTEISITFSVPHKPIRADTLARLQRADFHQAAEALVSWWNQTSSGDEKNRNHERRRAKDIQFIKSTVEHEYVQYIFYVCFLFGFCSELHLSSGPVRWARWIAVHSVLECRLEK